MSSTAGHDGYLQDIQEIRTLKFDYCELADRCCSPSGAHAAADAIIELFLQDGILEVPPEYGGRHCGREAIRTFWITQSAIFSFADHIVFHDRIEVDGESARGRWKNMIPVTTLVDGKSTALWILGNYEDEYAKVDGKWRIRSLKVIIRRVFGRDETGLA
jgi:hypothetical protein